ncbi:unnamed protein product [Microthlaspi erraticum]|uniref:Uncharacterized protein n=1 Tax=Microthlaspi erraticum TaxID=1685480 RepID=A0A6D2JCD6_9BRAS|nr:unnamed protein product [Microthlaspi erraticum]
MARCSPSPLPSYTFLGLDFVLQQRLQVPNHLLLSWTLHMFLIASMECGEVGIAALALELLLPSLICFFGGSMNGFFFFFILSFPFVFAIGVPYKSKFLGRNMSL